MSGRRDSARPAESAVPGPRAASHVLQLHRVPPTPIGTRPSILLYVGSVTIGHFQECRGRGTDGPAREGIRRRTRTSAGGPHRTTHACMHACGGHRRSEDAPGGVCMRVSPLSTSRARRCLSGSSGVGAPVGGGNGKPNRRSDGTILLGGPFRGPRVESGGRVRAIRLPSPVPRVQSARLPVRSAWHGCATNRNCCADDRSRTCRKNCLSSIVRVVLVRRSS